MKFKESFYNFPWTYDSIIENNFVSGEGPEAQDGLPEQEGRVRGEGRAHRQRG